MAILKKQRATGSARRAVCAACAVGLALPFAAGAESLSERVDTLYNSLDHLESRVRSTLLTGGSSPISFSGEARLKMQYHDLGFDAPAYMLPDRSYFQSGWEGNENLFRLGMVVRPGRNTVLWSKIGFQHTLTGNYNQYTVPGGIDGDGTFLYQYRHDKARNSISIHEDMSAGIAIRTLPVSFWLRMGNTMWTEASPLTIWKSQPRTFAWEYLPFEVEQPIARYYEYNIARGIKDGRAAWNKKPFNGLNLESINLPYNMYANFVYGTFERYDNFEREFIDLASDLGYANIEGILFPAKSHGIGDTYRHVIHGRVANTRLFGRDLTLGLNYVGIDYRDDILYAFKDVFPTGINDDPGRRSRYLLLAEFRGNDSVFYKEPKTISLDFKGVLSENFSIHADVAINWVDTTWWMDTVSTETDPARTANIRRHRPDWYEVSSRSGGLEALVPAAFLRLNYNGVFPVEADLAFIGKGFYSPFSFVVPEDAFFAYGANMVGAGKFVNRGEGSPYAQNMAGVNLTFNPKLPGYGHLRVKYGQHFNVEEGRDVLYFPYRLNGADMFSFFHSSFNRWGNGLVDNSIKAGNRNYIGRLGDESYFSRGSYNNNFDSYPASINTAGPQAGGLRSDFLAMFEGFVPYRDVEEAYRNFSIKNVGTTAQPGVSTATQTSITHQTFAVPVTDAEGNVVDSLRTTSSWVPESRKYTFNLELDAAYDIGSFIGYNKDLFIGGYAGIHGISSTFKPLAFSDEADDMLLMSYYVRLEPAIAFAKNFYLLGLVGWENWRSQRSWMMVNGEGKYVNPSTYNTAASMQASFNNPAPSVDNFRHVPINYHDWAFGLGFDWDMLERVGLHFRAKWMSHADEGLNQYYDNLNAARVSEGLDPINFTPQDKSDWSTWVLSLELKTWF